MADATLPIAVVSVSGGKDSTATALRAVEEYGRDRVRLVFADTGNEHETTLEYVQHYLPEALGIPVETVRADFSQRIAKKRMFIARDQRNSRDGNGKSRRWTNKAKRRALEILHPTGNPFLDLCLWKGRFPSRMAQFCTEELKIIPLNDQIDRMFGEGITPESWRGIRRDESQNRRNAQARFIESTQKMAYWVVQPIVDWTAARVFEYCAAHGIAPNPLYKQGMGRVGCMPCINCGKDELLEISRRFPEHVERIREWERVVGSACKYGESTFFTDADKGKKLALLGIRQTIDQRVLWATTSRGGLQSDWLRSHADVTQCSSQYGLCE
jgi:3'-phosphoadenosine 5'-phosphosulfate sulfotransferase (PAPS reductase)/FAD synthetase